MDNWKWRKLKTEIEIEIEKLPQIIYKEI